MPGQINDVADRFSSLRARVKIVGHVYSLVCFAPLRPLPRLSRGAVAAQPMVGSNTVPSAGVRRIPATAALNASVVTYNVIVILL